MKYIVQPWETWEKMGNIALRFGITLNELVDANPILKAITIYPGMILNIPVPKEATLPEKGYIEYVVQSGDSLYKIANRFHLNYKKVVSDNPQIANPNVIWPGQIIYLIYQ
jgi:tyrosinase